MTEQRVGAAALKSYVAEIMRSYGIDDGQVASVSDNMIWSELVGRPNFGVLRLPIFIERVRKGVLRRHCRPRFEPLGETIELLDGDDGFGQHVAQLGMARAIELARRGGVGIVGVRNSNFFGTGAYFVHMAAEAGMIGLAMSNSFPKVVAHGGIRPVLGTNPFAFGAPRRGGDSLMLDMATSALAGSTVREHIAKGEELPIGLAVDDRGHPITDPKKIDTGALLPFGGAKGYGLALMVEMLAGVITGAGISDGVASLYKNFSESGHSGHFLLALDISRWMPMDTYFARMDYLVSAAKASDPDGGVLLPGEIRWQQYRENVRNGVAVEGSARRALLELSRRQGIEAPWADPAAGDGAAVLAALGRPTSPERLDRQA